MSLTPVCNFACRYCDPESSPGKEPVPITRRPADFYLRLVERLLEVTPLHTVRLTGGEPTLYAQLASLVAGLAALGLSRICLTTNGFLLESQLEALKAAGLTDLNVSVDAIEPAVFERVTGRGGLDRVLGAIDRARGLALPLKINATIMRGLNDCQVLPVFEQFAAAGIEVRFLELMKMGPLQTNHEQFFFSEAEILARICERFTVRRLERQPSATATLFETGDGRRFGIIANHSAPFCSDCDRLRLDHEGRLFGCLSSAIGYTVPDDKHALIATLKGALEEKQPQRFTGSALSMRSIGG
ncbi:MAG: radical SAM protein [Spirochaetales bacterium]|nr:radical SAM protein [Spirochaetales bacterium]MCP5485702.1 radical SAM protein [Spirochaetales bacterium]